MKFIATEVMSGLATNSGDLGADDEVKEFTQEEEEEFDRDESLNDIKSELEQEADSEKAKVSAVISPPPALIATAQSLPGNRPALFLSQVNGGIMSPRLPFVPRPGQIMDPKMLQMASVYSIQPLSGLQGVSTLRMDAPSSTTSNSGIVYPSYAPSIPVVPTNPGYPYVIGSNCVPVQLQQQMLQNGVLGPNMMSSSAQPEKKKPHIKKPLNAFMLFMKAKRAEVMKECTLKESAAINQILGKKWHALTKDEQEKYYDLARQERAKHLQMYPGWSARDNYAIHKKKKRRKPHREEEENISISSTCTNAGSDGDPNAKKCRARYGMDQQHMWCQPCRRKKKCERVEDGEEQCEDIVQLQTLSEADQSVQQSEQIKLEIDPKTLLNDVPNVTNGKLQSAAPPISSDWVSANS